MGRFLLCTAPAESKPILEKAALTLNDLFAGSSFDAEELTVVWQTINVEHNCHYCVPARTGSTHSMKIGPTLTEALRHRQLSPNAQQQVAEIILGLAHKLITNYTNHIANTPPD